MTMKANKAFSLLLMLIIFVLWLVADRVGRIEHRVTTLEQRAK